jgi:hypothetical protein
MDLRPHIESAIHRDAVARALTLGGSERMADGPRLFDYACAVAIRGIRAVRPHLSEAAAREELRKRLEMQRVIEGQS